MPLKASCLVSSGAITGVHDIMPQQSSRISFGKDGEIFCAAIAGGAESPAFLKALKA
jgi:2-keto-4-pentenoate hydratase